MRILHVVTAFPRYEGDVIAPWLVELLQRHRPAGHDVEVFCSAYRGGGGGGASYEGIPVHRFRYFPARWEDLTHDEAAPDRMRRSWRYKVMPAFYVAGGMLAIWRLCRQRRYDVVHVHWPMPHALFGAVARVTCGARLVTSWYGIELRWVQSSLPWLRWLVRWALNTSDQVVAISSYTAREIKRVSDVPVRVIPYTVGLPDAAPPSPAGRRDGAFRILFVGRLVERKGVAGLVDAVGQLPASSRVRLEIVGEGPERPRLEAQVEGAGLGDRVALRGRISAAELREAYAAADVLVLPSVLDSRSDTEGLGVVLLEAMSYGVPVIGSRVGGIPDIIVDGETGLLVSPGDPAALAAALQRLVDDPALRARLARAGREHVRAHFSWDRIVAQWEECYAAALA